MWTMASGRINEEETFLFSKKNYKYYIYRVVIDTNELGRNKRETLLFKQKSYKYYICEVIVDNEEWRKK